jgi:thioredoxin-like negative regulator of GroEL
VKPVVDRLEPEYSGRITFIKHDEVWSNRESAAFASENGIRAVPTMVLVSPDGREIERILGGADEARIRGMLDSGLN